ncbi:serine/threonine-protein kinase [Sagittula salina]|uniref:Protein kinase n=1 Tax=Sagittula salina TaxID=2820268 RepID=A0A940MS53_9RHOB|nr:serine/threonine-protein kinase [Sagittula salina]MBP0484978.1 protein kinase [Sagittula salina]
MSGGNDTPEDDERTVFTPQPGTTPAAEDDERTQFAPPDPQGWPPRGATTQTGSAQAGPTETDAKVAGPNGDTDPARSEPRAGGTYQTAYPPQGASTHPGMHPGEAPQPTATSTDPSYHPEEAARQAETYAGSVPPPDPSSYPHDPAAPAAPPGTQTAAEIARTDGKLPIGTLINNNYRIEEVLKSGGMGEVYRGIEIHTGDPVAIKAILQEKADDAEAGLLFLREAKTLRRLTDETIVRYYNYVPDPDLQRYFMVMEFIEGVPLKDHVAQNGPLSVDECRTLLARLAGGLATAHDAEVIHRDLSPDNVMLEGGRVENARLIDFGIAQSSVVKEATMAGRFAGKFKYVAPEQLGHYGGEISPATDIYGLALLTAAAAIGKPLDMGSSIVEAVQSRQSIPDLSYAPEDLRPILSYMLEPNPADRPEDMRTVKTLVEDPRLIPERYLGGWVPPAPPPLHDPGPDTGAQSMAATMAPGLQLPGATQNVTLNTSLGPTPLPEEKSRGGGLVAVLILLLLAGLGGGGYYAWTTGLLDGLIGTQSTDGGDTPDAAAPPEQTTGIPGPQADTREGFLAAFETGPCTFVTRVSQGANAGVIEGYSATREAFTGLPTAYEEKFGARPEVVPREITPQQCAVLDFAKALQGRGRSGVEMFLSANEVASKTPVTAQLSVPPGQAVWLVLVTPTGGIINVTERLSPPAGNQRTMTFALQLPAGAEPAPQLLLAVEADSPLARAALAKNRDQAAAALPLILEEIRDRGGAASAAVSYLKLMPPDP